LLLAVTVCYLAHVQIQMTDGQTDTQTDGWTDGRTDSIVMNLLHNDQ